MTSLASAAERLTAFADFIRKPDSRPFRGHDKRIDLSDDIRLVLAALATPDPTERRYTAADLQTAVLAERHRLSVPVDEATGGWNMPVDWRLVPKEPTPAMIAAGWAHDTISKPMGQTYIHTLWMHMLAAAPAPPETAGVGE